MIDNVILSHKTDSYDYLTNEKQRRTRYGKEVKDNRKNEENELEI